MLEPSKLKRGLYYPSRFAKLVKRGKEQLKSYEGHALKEALLMSPLPHDNAPTCKLVYL